MWEEKLQHKYLLSPCNSFGGQLIPSAKTCPLFCSQKSTMEPSSGILRNEDSKSKGLLSHDCGIPCSHGWGDRKKVCQTCTNMLSVRWHAHKVSFPCIWCLPEGTNNKCEKSWLPVWNTSPQTLNDPTAWQEENLPQRNTYETNSIQKYNYKPLHLGQWCYDITWHCDVSSRFSPEEKASIPSPMIPSSKFVPK